MTTACRGRGTWRIAAWLALPLLATMAADARPAGAGKQGMHKMADVTLTLALPQPRVIAGENFPLKITITNTGPSAAAQPAHFVDDDYRFVLTPAGGGQTVVLSRAALDAAPRPGNPIERLTAPPAPLAEPLAAGASREAQVFPARLATQPIPAGDYALTVSLLSAPAVVSAPVRLTVEPPKIVGHLLTGGGSMEGSELSFVHRDGAGAFHFFAGEVEADAPTRLAGLRIAQITKPIQGLQFSHAVQSEPSSAPLVAAWLAADGSFFAAVARSAYVVANPGPVDLGLAEAQLAPTGWKSAALQVSATFAVLGKRGSGLELVLATLDRDGNWVPKLRRTALALPGMPKVWRISRRADGGHVLFAAYQRDIGTSILKLDITADGVAQGGGVELLRTAEPLVALSAPSTAVPGSVLQALSGPASAEKLWVVTEKPIDGGAAKESRFRADAIDGAQPVDWSLAEGAPARPIVAARIGATVVGLRIRDAMGSVTPLHRQPGAVAPRAVAIASKAWVVWRDGEDRIESRLLP